MKGLSGEVGVRLGKGRPADEEGVVDLFWLVRAGL